MLKSKSLVMFTILLILIVCIIFSSYPVVSLIASNVTIKNSGKIVPILPLHVDGKYIKNYYNQTVILRGVNKVEFADDPDGIWMGSTMWTDSNVKAELDIMKSWGVNVVDFHISIELTKYDIGPNSGHPASPYCSISAMEALRRVAQFAAEKGIYVIFGGYSVRSYWSGADQDALPFPPYQKSVNASEIIASKEEFAEWWGMLAREFKNYPNVIFELWNEPHNTATANKTNDEAFADWVNATQQCINAIRAAGFTGLIIHNWETGVYCAILEDEQGNPYGKWGYRLQDWVPNFLSNISDPTGNIVLGVHGYCSEGAVGLYTEPSLQEKWGTYYPYVYSHVKTALEYEGLKWWNETVNYPLHWGEFGLRMGWKDSGNIDAHNKEVERFTNQLTVFHEYGLHYECFWWRNIGIYRLHSGPPNFTPTDGGQILKTYLSGSQQGK